MTTRPERDEPSPEQLARWDAILSGRLAAEGPDDAPARLLQEALADPNSPTDLPPDPARVDRMMKRLAARGAFQRPDPARLEAAIAPTPAPTAQPTAVVPAAAARPGTRPPLADAGARWVAGRPTPAVWMGVALVLLLPAFWWWTHGQPAPAPEGGPAAVFSKHAGAEQRRWVERPDTAASSLAGELGQLGATVQITEEGPDRLVVARWPDATAATRLAEAEMRLGRQGISLPPDAPLVVRYVPMPVR